MKHNFDNWAIKKERVDHKVVWEGQTPPQNTGSWPLTNRDLCFIKTFLLFFTCTHCDLIISSVWMKVDFQMCWILLLSLFLKAKRTLGTILRKAGACDVLRAPMDSWYHSHSTTTDSWRSPWKLSAQNQDGWRKMWLSCYSYILSSIFSPVFRIPHF